MAGRGIPEAINYLLKLNYPAAKEGNLLGGRHNRLNIREGARNLAKLGLKRFRILSYPAVRMKHRRMIPVKSIANALHFFAKNSAGNIRHHVPGPAMILSAGFAAKLTRA
jgi:hypothetical protein